MRSISDRSNFTAMNPDPWKTNTKKNKLSHFGDCILFFFNDFNLFEPVAYWMMSPGAQHAIIKCEHRATSNWYYVKLKIVCYQIKSRLSWLVGVACRSTHWDRWINHNERDTAYWKLPHGCEISIPLIDFQWETRHNNIWTSYCRTSTHTQSATAVRYILLVDTIILRFTCIPFCRQETKRRICFRIVVGISLPFCRVHLRHTNGNSIPLPLWLQCHSPSMLVSIRFSHPSRV